MPWMELSLHTTHEAIDWIRTSLAAADYEGEVQMVPYAEAQDAEMAPANQAAPWAFTVYLYLPDDWQGRTQAEQIAAQLHPLQRLGLTTELDCAIASEKPIPAAGASPVHRVGQRWVILPPSLSYQPTAAELPIRLQPTLAFGSGLHPATRLSLQLLERYVQPTMQTLDLGSGSGILSVAMAKLGAQVLALDNDPVAVAATQAAVELNGLTQQVTVQQGSLGQGSHFGHWLGGDAIATVPGITAADRFDLIMANILARVHVALAADYRQALRSTATTSGLLIVSGLTTDYEADVADAMTAVGLMPIACDRWQEWVALAYRLEPQ